jgi:hypothetical protein
VQLVDEQDDARAAILSRLFDFVEDCLYPLLVFTLAETSGSGNKQ